MDYYAEISHEIIEAATTQKEVSPANVKVLGFPLGLSKYGEHLKDRGVEVDISTPNTLGKVRVNFSLPCRIITTNGAQVVSLREGEYDFLMQSAEKEDWSGWFND